jgi:hypothetical protein
MCAHYQKPRIFYPRPILSRASQPRHGRSAAYLELILCSAIILLLISGGLLLRSTQPEQASNSRIEVKTPALPPLPVNPQDPLVVADLATVRAFRDALQHELVFTNSKLVATPGDLHQLRRRYAIEKMLSNAGGSGLSDRLAEFDKATNRYSSPSFDPTRDQPFVTKAIRDLHYAAVSCRSGALADAAKYIGISIPHND